MNGEISPFMPFLGIIPNICFNPQVRVLPYEFRATCRPFGSCNMRGIRGNVSENRESSPLRVEN
jgi:hypothetical protein